MFTTSFFTRTGGWIKYSQPMKCNIPDDNHLHTCHHVNLKSHLYVSLLPLPTPFNSFYFLPSHSICDLWMPEPPILVKMTIVKHKEAILCMSGSEEDYPSDGIFPMCCNVPSVTFWTSLLCFTNYGSKENEILFLLHIVDLEFTVVLILFQYICTRDKVLYSDICDTVIFVILIF
jgi:hypothetical protein